MGSQESDMMNKTTTSFPDHIYKFRSRTTADHRSAVIEGLLPCARPELSSEGTKTVMLHPAFRGLLIGRTGHTPWRVRGSAEQRGGEAP